MGTAVKFRQTKPAPQPGEVARLRVVQGPDSGCVFVLTGPRATMGRGDENDIVLADLKSSRRHAEITAGPAGEWRLKDLGSSNGILFEGQVIREGGVKTGNRFMVGETLLEFQQAGIPAVAHSAPAWPTQPAAPVQLPGFSTTPASMGGMNGFPGSAGVSSGTIAGIGAVSGAGSGLNVKKLIIYGVVLAGVYLLLFVDADSPVETTKAPKKKQASARDLASFLPEYEPGKAGPAEAFFREGFREYRERNYLRAKTQFETVLQISPSHYLASIYLRKCDEDISREVESHLVQGKKDAEAGKLKAAKNHYESVMRLLHRDRTHASFVEAKEALSAVEKAMRGEAKL